MLPTSYYDKRRADYAVDFIQNNLYHTAGKWLGQPFKLLNWQETIIRDIFGIINEDGFRQFRTAYVEIGKKNGKSELASAIALYLLFADKEPAAEVYSCAADTNQASIVFRGAMRMLELCPNLHKLSKLVPSQKTIHFPLFNSFYKVLSSETKAKQGFNVSGLIFDELFAQKDRELYDTMTKYTGDARQQPLYFLITTAGRDRNSLCYEVHQKAKAVLEGTKIDPAFYPAVYGMEDGDDWRDEKVWWRVNPSLGVTVEYKDVHAAYLQALESHAEEMHFRQFRLNEWTNADVRWMPMDKWDNCAEDFDFSDFEGRDCYAGLDLSKTQDLTALVLVFPPTDDDPKYTIIQNGFMCPNDVRKLEDLNPIENPAGDKFYFNGNMLPIELAGRQYVDEEEFKQEMEGDANEK